MLVNPSFHGFWGGPDANKFLNEIYFKGSKQGPSHTNRERNILNLFIPFKKTFIVELLFVGVLARRKPGHKRPQPHKLVKERSEEVKGKEGVFPPPGRPLNMLGFCRRSRGMRIDFIYPLKYILTNMGLKIKPIFHTLLEITV